MEPAEWMTACALVLFVLEGFALAVFPRQFQELIVEADPRLLQAAGLLETMVAVGLLLGIMLS